MEDLKLSDEVIGHVAKVLQLALLTGTDVVDNLRMLRLQNDDGVLNVHPISQEIFDKSIHEMIADVEVLRMKKTHLDETGEEFRIEPTYPKGKPKELEGLDFTDDRLEV